MDAEYRHAETDFQVHDTTGNLTLTTQGLERRLCQEKYKFWHFIYQLIIWYFSNSDIFIYVLSSNVKNVTSTSNPFLCAADFFLQLGSCKEAIR